MAKDMSIMLIVARNVAEALRQSQITQANRRVIHSYPFLIASREEYITFNKVTSLIMSWIRIAALKEGGERLGQLVSLNSRVVANTVRHPWEGVIYRVMSDQVILPLISREFVPVDILPADDFVAAVLGFFQDPNFMKGM